MRREMNWASLGSFPPRALSPVGLFNLASVGDPRSGGRTVCTYSHRPLTLVEQWQMPSTPPSSGRTSTTVRT